jgi:hypothetical protein
MVLTACGASSQTPAPVSPTKAAVEPTTPATSIAFSNGRFIKSGSTTGYGFAFEDGNFSTLSGMNMISGTYEIDGNVFTETSNTGGCKTNVSFNYTFDGSALIFTYVGNPEDDVACDGRRADFNNVTYILTPLSLPFPTGKFMRADRVDPVGLIFNADGTWQAWDQYMNIITKGTYSVDGETYTELSNEAGCSTPISFKYTYDGETLTFNYVGDPAQDTCDARRVSFDNVPYTLTGK